MPFLSAHSPASFVGGRIVFLSSRLPSRLPVSYGRLVAILCGSLVYPFHLVDLPTSRRSVFRFVFSSRSAVRFSSRSSSRSLVSSSSPCSLFSLGRLISAARGASRVISVLFSSVLRSFVRCVSWPWRRRLVLLLPCGCAFLSLLPSVIVEPWRLRKWACRSTIRRDAPFYSARFPIRAGNEMTMMIWIRPPQYEGNGERQQYGDR